MQNDAPHAPPGDTPPDRPQSPEHRPLPHPPSIPPHPTDERITPPRQLFADRFALDRPKSQPLPGDCTRLRSSLLRWLPPGLPPTGIPIPSFSLHDPELARAPGTPEPNAEPAVRFASTMDARHLAEITVEPGTTLHGLGMHAAPLERSGRRYQCWNTDWPAYDQNNPGLYQSHPIVFAVTPTGDAFAAIADTTWRSHIDLTTPNAIRFTAEGHPFPVLIIHAESPSALTERIAEHTGQTPMLPRWALGYHQCRWSYYPAGKALRVAQQFRQRNIPCDVLWFDIHYMQDYRIFTFHEERFPDPASLNRRLHDMGFRTVWMIDPAPKRDPSDPVYAAGLAGNHFTLTANAEPFVGSVWAGPSCFPDFTRAETRAWWADLYQTFMANGIDGVWNDMNEPSVFDQDSKTMPESCWHRGDNNLPPAPHAAYHNAYGTLMARASRDGIQRAKPDKRPFVLTRSNFLGGHRYAATWTGDNSATWQDLARSIPMVLSMSLSGQLISGPDIGGFIDNSEGDPRLFARWMGIGCLLPFARAHVAEGSIDKEPWSFGPECEATCKRAIETRYRLLPYLYTLAHHAHTRGTPIAAPLFFADPTDPRLRREDRAFLIGQDLLAECDVLPPNTTPDTPIQLPTPEWRPITLTEHDPDLPTLRLRPGAAIPVGPVIQHTDQQTTDPLTVIAAPDDQGNATGLLYEDDGDGYDFQSGRYRLTELRVTIAASGRPALEPRHLEGDRPEPDRTVRLITV